MQNISSFESFFTNGVSVTENNETHQEEKNYMFFQNLRSIKRAIEEMMEMDRAKIDQILEEGHGWAIDHIATSADDVMEVHNFLVNHIEEFHSEGSEEEYEEEPEVEEVETEEFEEMPEEGEEEGEEETEEEEYED
jgi:hypothetical protein